jgi:hypothetical protein
MVAHNIPSTNHAEPNGSGLPRPSAALSGIDRHLRKVSTLYRGHHVAKGQSRSRGSINFVTMMRFRNFNIGALT